MTRLDLRGASSAVLGAALSLMSVTPTLAQEVAEGETDKSSDVVAPDEIVVTATKQGAISLQRIPAGISAVTGAALERQNLRSIEDVARLTPSLQFAKQGEGDLQLIIRGIQSPGVSTVGFYLDETVINGVNFGSGGGRTPDIGAYDIDRVEVLKGPQGTLFGASSMSGTVRIITKKPDAKQFSGSVAASVSDTHDGGTNYGGEAILNVPIVKDKLAARGVFWRERSGGFIDAYFGVNGATFVKDANTSKKTGGRIALRYTPTSNITIDGFYTQQDLRVNGPSVDAPEPSGVLMPITIVSGPPSIRGRVIPPSGGVAADRVFTDPARPRSFNRVKIYGATAQLDTDAGTLVATASNYELDYKTTFALTGSAVARALIDQALFAATGELRPVGSIPGDQSQSREVFSSEVRFSSTFNGPFNFVVGGSYFDDRNETEMTVKVGDPITGESLCYTYAECVADPTSPGARSLVYSTGAINRVKSFALFLNGDYALTDRFKLNGGVRYFRARLHDIAITKQAFQSSIPPATPPAYGGPVQLVPTIGLDARDTQKKVTWSGGLSYEIDSTKLLYTRAGTGFRQGGINNFNGALQLGIVIPHAFEPDTVLNLEAGAKLSFLDRRLTLNAAYFHMFWENIQVPGNNPTGGVSYIENGTNARIDGVEVEVISRPTDHFSLSLAATYLSAKLSKDQVLQDAASYSTLPPIGKKGDRIPNIPDITLSVVGQYRVPGELFPGVETTFDASYSYVGKSYNAFSDAYVGYRQLGDFSLLNLGVNFDYGPATVRIYANNVTDTVGTIDYSTGTSNVATRATNRPRTIGALLRVRF